MNRYRIKSWWHPNTTDRFFVAQYLTDRGIWKEILMEDGVSYYGDADSPVEFVVYLHDNGTLCSSRDEAIKLQIAYAKELAKDTNKLEYEETGDLINKESEL